MEALPNVDSEKERIISSLKAAHREQEISSELERLEREHPRFSSELAHLEGESFDHYMHDMAITQEYASLNRATIAQIIISHMGWQEVSRFETIHNYIDMEHMILRKGAVSAQQGEMLIIPINMRDGSLVCCGKGNPDWNCSAPHGAGRLMSRSAAKDRVSMSEYKESMRGIFTTSVNQLMLDEAPQAYI